MANTAIELPAERKIGKRRMSPLRWAATIGWKHVIGLAVVVYSLFPILYIISLAFSDSGDVTSGLFGTFTTKNFEQLFAGDDPDRPFVQWVINTVWIASVSSIGSVFLSALAAYSFSRQRFRGRRSGLLTLILLQMFPSVLGLVAIYAILSELYKYVPALGLNSPWGLILVYLGGSLGGGTYLMYGFFNTVPKEIDEAAKIDGATHTQIYFQIILRLVSPILAVATNHLGRRSRERFTAFAEAHPNLFDLSEGLVNANPHLNFVEKFRCLVRHIKRRSVVVWGKPHRQRCQVNHWCSASP